MKLPEKTVERLSQYRRSLLECLEKGKHHIFSHELAAMHHNTAVQVRRDIMLIGYTGQLRKGYDVKELSDKIGKILDTHKGLNVAVVGIGNLGRAITTYFNGKRSKLRIVATFDSDASKIGRVISGVKCYNIDDMAKIIEDQNISVAIITTPSRVAKSTAERLVMAGIKGILNFTPVSLNVTPNVYLEEYDMTTSLEKVAYFVKEQTK